MLQTQTRHGQKAREELQAELTKLELSNTFLDIPTDMINDKQYKDVNEWLCSTDKDTFKDNIEQNIYNKFANDLIYFYMDDYYKKLSDYSKQPIKSTGFNLLDEQLEGGIKSGLYVLGAIPSLRKNNPSFTNSRQYGEARA